MSNPRDIIFAPVVSEKSYDLIEDHNTYTFEIDPRANKTQVRQAIEEIFGVKVVRVNTQNRKGKPRRYRFRFGRTKNWKKAIVTLHSENRIDFF